MGTPVLKRCLFRQLNWYSCLSGCSVLWLLFCCGACRITTQQSKYAFTEGVYLVKAHGLQRQRMYVEPEDETVLALPLKNRTSLPEIDSTAKLRLHFPLETEKPPYPQAYFLQHSLDIDVLTILFKYRPETSGFPRQLNTNFNGAVYLGYRTDIYKLSYRRTLAQLYRLQEKHYGYSFGLFAGLGGTTMNPSVTQQKVQDDYDGVVFTKGVSAIIGVDKFTFGLALGTDNLLDPNRRYWIYQQKPWLGLSVGLNLN